MGPTFYIRLVPTDMTSAAETQRCYDSLRYPRERLYHDLDAAEVKQRSTSCRMCRTLWQCLTVANNGPPRTHADGGTLRVRTLSTRFACFVLANTDLRIELKRLSVGLVPAKPGHGAEDTNDFKDALVVLYHAFQTCDSYPESVEALCEWEGRQLSSDSTMYGIDHSTQIFAWSGGGWTIATRVTTSAVTRRLARGIPIETIQFARLMFWSSASSNCPLHRH